MERVEGLAALAAVASDDQDRFGHVLIQQARSAHPKGDADEVRAGVFLLQPIRQNAEG